MKGLKHKMMGKSLNKNMRFIFYTNFITILACLILQSCNMIIIKPAGPLASPNIKESKHRGAFLWEYYPIREKVNDSLDLDILEVFAEKEYSFNTNTGLRYINSKNNTQLIILFKKDLTEIKHFDLWMLADFTGSSPYNLIKIYKNTYPPDTLLVKILKVDVTSDGLAGEDNKKEIGSFLLYRKIIEHTNSTQ